MVQRGEAFWDIRMSAREASDDVVEERLFLLLLGCLVRCVDSVEYRDGKVYEKYCIHRGNFLHLFPLYRKFVYEFQGQRSAMVLSSLRQSLRSQRDSALNIGSCIRAINQIRAPWSTFQGSWDPVKFERVVWCLQLIALGDLGAEYRLRGFGETDADFSEGHCRPSFLRLEQINDQPFGSQEALAAIEQAHKSFCRTLESHVLFIACLLRQPIIQETHAPAIFGSSSPEQQPKENSRDAKLGRATFQLSPHFEEVYKTHNVLWNVSDCPPQAVLYRAEQYTSHPAMNLTKIVNTLCGASEHNCSDLATIFLFEALHIDAVSRGIPKALQRYHSWVKHMLRFSRVTNDGGP